MSINLKTLISYDRLIESPGEVMDLVEEHGRVVLLRNNTPAYIVMKADDAAEIKISSAYEKPKKSALTLHKAMKLVLSEAEGNQMHAADLADEIFQRGLYKKKDGSKANYNQIRARCTGEKYQKMFDTSPGNIIKLKTE